MDKADLHCRIHSSWISRTCVMENKSMRKDHSYIWMVLRSSYIQFCSVVLYLAELENTEKRENKKTEAISWKWKESQVHEIKQLKNLLANALLYLASTTLEQGGFSLLGWSTFIRDKGQTFLWQTTAILQVNDILYALQMLGPLILKYCSKKENRLTDKLKLLKRRGEAVLTLGEALTKQSTHVCIPAMFSITLRMFHFKS